MYCASSVVWMPRRRWRVVCGLREVIASFWPISVFSSVDLPTLGRPTMAIVPQRNSSFMTCLAVGRPRSGAGKRFVRATRRFLLGQAAAGAGAERTRVERRNAALDLETLIVRCAVRRHDIVLRERVFAALQPLLQLRFGILVGGDGRV